MSRKFAISDIHGCARTFRALVEKLELTPKDELYLLGDYIDRGPDSKGVIDYIWKLQADGHTVHCLMGNHEALFLEEVEEGCTSIPNYLETLHSFGVSHVGDIPKPYISWIESLGYYFEVGHYILVHAALNFQREDPFSDVEEILWGRYWYDFIDPEWLGERIIVHGHTPTHMHEIQQQLEELEQCPAIVIDNGCVFDLEGHGNLLALELGTNTLTVQPSQELV